MDRDNQPGSSRSGRLCGSVPRTGLLRPQQAQNTGSSSRTWDPAGVTMCSPGLPRYSKLSTARPEPTSLTSTTPEPPTFLCHESWNPSERAVVLLRRENGLASSTWCRSRVGLHRSCHRLASRHRGILTRASSHPRAGRCGEFDRMVRSRPSSGQRPRTASGLVSSTESIRNCNLPDPLPCARYPTVPAMPRTDYARNRRFPSVGRLLRS